MFWTQRGGNIAIVELEQSKIALEVKLSTNELLGCPIPFRFFFWFGFVLKGMDIVGGTV